MENIKKSEDYFEKSRQEDNDIISFGLRVKALREARSERFLEDWLPLLSERYSINESSQGKYSITTEDYGVIDYFPKANKILIRVENTWKKPGLRWLVKNLLND